MIRNILRLPRIAWRRSPYHALAHLSDDVLRDIGIPPERVRRRVSADLAVNQLR